MKSVAKKCLVFSLALFSLVVISLAIFVFMLVDKQASTHPTHQINPQHAAYSKQLAKRLAGQLKSASQSAATITLAQKEINGLTALAHRAIPRAAIDIRLSPNVAVLLASYQLPGHLGEYFVNLKASLLPSTNGLELAKVTVGDIELSGETTLSLLSFVLDWYAGAGSTQKVLSSIQQVAINPMFIKVDMAIDPSLVNRADDNSLLAKLRDDLALFGDSKAVNFYYQTLVTKAQRIPRDASLADFTQVLFSHAQDPSTQHPTASYVEQNQAMLVALALYFGTNKFELFVANIEQLQDKEWYTRYYHRQQVTLAGRNDLQKHFIYSIALQLLSDNQTSDALGEFKEFLDTNRGGSGFSFVDLLADRAGTRLANIATYSEAQAQQVQAMLATASEQALLPDSARFEEGLTEAGFSKKYQGVGSSAYESKVAELDKQLKTLPLYQLAW